MKSLPNEFNALILQARGPRRRARAPGSPGLPQHFCDVKQAK